MPRERRFLRRAPRRITGYSYLVIGILLALFFSATLRAWNSLWSIALFFVVAGIAELLPIQRERAIYYVRLVAIIGMFGAWIVDMLYRLLGGN